MECLVDVNCLMAYVEKLDQKKSYTGQDGIIQYAATTLYTRGLVLKALFELHVHDAFYYDEWKETLIPFT